MILKEFPYAFSLGLSFIDLSKHQKFIFNILSGATKMADVKISFNMSDDEYWDGANDFNGICLNCGEVKYGGVEPDASEYECEVCEVNAVMGFEQAMLEGKIKLQDC